LSKIPAETIRLKQQAIARLAPRIQYAMPPLELLRNRSDQTPWDPPFPDGVEVALDGIFLRTAKALQNASTGIPPRLQTNREWSQEYDVVKIQIPGRDSREAQTGVGAGGGGRGEGRHPHRGKGEGKRAPGKTAPGKPAGALGAPNEEGLSL
jgi:hypothetical protein